ncbi:hypothetical protein FHS89_002464 [Rubricella aquisinus]|uniref:PAS domain-containing protein n=1 Tax=Rubricella aquisinus TaxID=2028108 RepID=A0A840WQW2_9RHOB|nr:PAS domain-containing protein [Rubricella aquisinus]MBB5516433.1 hypothetical protein [Rubricella aquisinus]
MTDTSPGVIIHEYWNRLRGGRLVPMREELDPRRFVPALEHLILLEHDLDGPARIRVGGVRLNELMGAEVRGMPGRALFRSEDQPRAEATFTRVLAEPAMADMRVMVVTPGGMTRRGIVTLRPLATQEAGVSRIMGTVAIDGKDVLDPQTKLTILSVNVIALRHEKPKLVAQPAFAEAQAPFTPRPPRGRPQLRLVVSQD